MADDFCERYGNLLTGSYDCVDRIVLNAYYPMGSTAGGFRTWWRRMIEGSDAEADGAGQCSPDAAGGPVRAAGTGLGRR